MDSNLMIAFLVGGLLIIFVSLWIMRRDVRRIEDRWRKLVEEQEKQITELNDIIAKIQQKL